MKRIGRGNDIDKSLIDVMMDGKGDRRVMESLKDILKK